ETSAIALAATLTEMGATAPVPAFLVMNTVQAASLNVMGKALAEGCATARALALAEDAVKGMAWTRAKLVCVMLVVSLAAGGLGMAGCGVLAGKSSSEFGETAVGEETRGDKSVQREDSLPQGASTRIGTLRWRHTGIVNFIEFLPGARHVVSAASDRY